MSIKNKRVVRFQAEAIAQTDTRCDPPSSYSKGSGALCAEVKQSFPEAGCSLTSAVEFKKSVWL